MHARLLKRWVRLCDRPLIGHQLLLWCRLWMLHTIPCLGRTHGWTWLIQLSAWCWLWKLHASPISGKSLSIEMAVASVVRGWLLRAVRCGGSRCLEAFRSQHPWPGIAGHQIRIII